MRKVLLCLSLIFWFPCVLADELDTAVSLALKTRYLGKLGSTVDSNPVLQPYVEASHQSGFYGYLWLNLPLEEDNPSRSLEFEPSVGYKQPWGGWELGVSLTLFDIQNPDVLDFEGDVLGSNIKLSNQLFYIESLYYAADDATDGLLGGMGMQKAWRGISLLANINYVDGPFNFGPISYAKFTGQLTLDAKSMDVFIEVLDIVHKTDPNERRQDEFALGIRYKF